jgi:rhodanese-related sulfurtransferase
MERKILRYLVFIAVVGLFPGSTLFGTTAFGAGSISVPLGTIKELESVSFKGKVVLYCTAGVRSYKASKMFAAKGLEDLMDLKGGITDWASFGGDLVTGAKEASANEEEEDYFFTGTPPGATVPKGVCEIGIAPSMDIGGDGEEN